MLGVDVMSEKGEFGDLEEMREARGLEEDRLSLGSAKERNGRAQPDGSVKEKKQGVIKSFRESFKRSRERSTPSSTVKAINDQLDIDNGKPSVDLESPKQVLPPPSPSFSAGSPLTPPSHKPKLHSRTTSDPTFAFGGTLLSVLSTASIRRGLRHSKKDKATKPVTEVQGDGRKEIQERGMEIKKEKEGVRESYTPPNIPDTPLSVMQINKLIAEEQLEEAYLNLLSMRLEFQQEQEQCTEKAFPVDQAKKEKDLSLLFVAMQDKMKDIVRNSNTLPPHNTELLVDVARIIQEEEKREESSMVGPGGWRASWREAVSEGVQAKLASVHLGGRQENTSWLAVHLGLLGKTIVEDLENVKKDLQGSYPPSFKVFSTYVSCYHVAVGQHLKKTMQQVTDLKDYYALLDWILNCYESENIMGSLSLRPEMETENAALCLEAEFLEKLRTKYCNKVQEDIDASLDRILILEDQEIWKNGNQADTDDENFFISGIHMDIWEKVKSYAVNSKKIDVDLERKAVYACFEHLKQFPKRFESRFEPVLKGLSTTLGMDYQITYINTFFALKKHMEGYRDSCPTQVDTFSREVDGLVQRMLLGMEDQFKNETKPFLGRMMTRKWLSTDDDFQKLYSCTKNFVQQCAKMRPPYVQTVVSNLHYHMVKEYVSQLMKNNYSCKNRKHERAAHKIRMQWAKLRELFQDMETHHEWLHPLGDYLSDIIGLKNKKDIKNHLQPLVRDYPGISKTHLAAVLYFRGVVRGRERQVILQRLIELRRTLGATTHQSHALFSNIQVTDNTDCLADMPFSCFSFLLSDS